MPKTTKRTATKQAAKIARAHATELPKLEVKAQPLRRPPGYKAPARGIARYPWAVSIVFLLLLGSIYLLYANHAGPFAVHVPPTPNAHATATASAHAQATSLAQAKASATALAAVPSPCLKTDILHSITDASPAPSAADFQKITHTYSSAPAKVIDTKKVYCAGINTNRGLIVVELDPNLAPNTVNNFVFLAQHHFYDGIKFHRINHPGTQYSPFMAQTGDPQGNGSGGPGYKFNDEPVIGDYKAGTLAMANSGPNTNGSQFFINIADNTSSLQKSYNLFGRVVQGMDVVAALQGPGDDPKQKDTPPDVMNHVLIAIP